MLTAKNTTYEFSMDEVKKAIAKEMNVAPEKMEVEAVMEDYGDDRFGSVYKKVTGIKVTVKN